ncbi:FKBP-type peptidyl-prolyl cis-trans isomerase [Enterovibrio calviensis]|uniref:FKBP-type peptidyl-prolyl cis-trans isomerase n=1 Tax=Enterovibrio calviensis TaxID=91359 RepID=UPI000486FEDD|nr:FKBP-type peptidyl-prolyl cis-trans isomerase [Enterovibrio calviensis]
MDFALPLVIIVIFVFVILIRQKAKKVAEENKQLGAEFLEKNAQEEGVITTASGLQYKVLEQGEGEEHPTATSRVRVHYHGTLLDGSVFDSSVQRGEPIEFGLNQVIKGWTEGVQLMKRGEKTRFFIPSNLAYGNAAAGAIKPGSTLIFDVELLAFQ